MQVFDKVNEQFVLNQMKKQDRKAAKIGQRQDFLEKFACNNQISKQNIIEQSRNASGHASRAVRAQQM